MGIVDRVRSWFGRSRSTEPEPARTDELPYVPPPSEDARPRPGTMTVEPLRRSANAGFLV